MKRVALVVLIAAPLLSGQARAQAERFEIGQRLRAFENAWELHKEEAARNRALKALEQVIPLFFKGRLAGADRGVCAPPCRARGRPEEGGGGPARETRRRARDPARPRRVAGRPGRESDARDELPRAAVADRGGGRAAGGAEWARVLRT